MLKNLVIWLVIGLVLMTVFNQFNTRQSAQAPMEYSQFLEEVKAQRIAKVTIEGRQLKATTTEGKRVVSYSPGDIWLVSDLLKYGVKVEAKPEEEPSLLMNIFVSWFPMLLLIGVWIFFMRQMQGGGRGGAFSFGKSRARMLDESTNTVTFADVAGCEEAKEEVAELVDFLRDPSKFQKLGGRIPRGVLMVGAPGTGKTLLARAIAGEAKVPFFSISGSDFVEMFVGVGASRVRDLFEQAKQNCPCIIFMDEIDAVGRHRGAGMGGGHDEREQTLNQLLVEMDGFEMKDNIILIAATNRPDILDPALLRPGRFDRQVVVDRPDRVGRKRILEVHSRGKPIAQSVDLEALAGQTPGFTGADLSNLVNEAALLAARKGKRQIETLELEEGIMRVIAGPEKKTRLLSPKEREITAVHEMGHALVGHYLEHNDPVHKISIVGRGMALGYVITLPTEDKFMRSRPELMDTLAKSLGGRTAEELVFGEITTGAEDDLNKTTDTAKRMVMRWGMSEKLGPRTFGRDSGQPFLGRDFGHEADYSEEIAREIDDEIRRIVEDAHERARKVLSDHMDEMQRLSKVLIEYETIDREQFQALLAGTAPEEVFKDHEKHAQPVADEQPAKQPSKPRTIGLPLPGALHQSKPPDAPQGA
jgi:cell division protease FtsH